MRFSPRAATRLGVKPNSEMRAAIAASATPSTTSALTTSSSCRPSKKSGRACGPARRRPKLFQIGEETYVELTDSDAGSQGTDYTFEVTEAELQLIQEAATGAVAKS